MQHRHSRDSGKPAQASPGLRMYVDDDDGSVLSMKSCREKSPPTLWRRIGGSTSVVMVMAAITIGFFMGFDQAYMKFKSGDEKISDDPEAFARYVATSTPIEFLGRIQKAKIALVERLSNEYGDYASVLMDKSNLDLVFKMSSDSKSRYRRRIIIKLLKKQLAPKEKVTFTWVTAGDVRAAGFGNHVGNSYTSMLDETIRHAFAVVGLNVVAKNHGLYNYPSGPALALCMNDVYGSDIDILNWDFSLADGDFKYRAALFGMRATLLPSYPLLMMVDRGDDDRWERFSWVEGKVGAGLFDNQGLETLVALHFPDSVKVSAADKLPPAVRYLQCNGSIEGTRYCQAPRHVCLDDLGELCRNHKFLIKDSCDAVKYQSNWNSGWKEHRLRGRLIGIFMIQLLEDALLELDVSLQRVSHLLPSKRRIELLQRYEQLDAQDQFLLSNVPLPASMLGRYDEKVSADILPLLRRPASCFFSNAVQSEKTAGRAIDSRRLRSHRRLEVQGTLIISETNSSDTNNTETQALNASTLVMDSSVAITVRSDDPPDQLDTLSNSSSASGEISTTSTPTPTLPHANDVEIIPMSLVNTSELHVIPEPVVLSTAGEQTLDLAAAPDGEVAESVKVSALLDSSSLPNSQSGEEIIDVSGINHLQTGGEEEIVEAEAAETTESAVHTSGEVIEVAQSSESNKGDPLDQATLVDANRVDGVSVVIEAPTGNTMKQGEVIEASVPFEARTEAMISNNLTSTLGEIIVTSEGSSEFNATLVPVKPSEASETSIETGESVGLETTGLYNNNTSAPVSEITLDPTPASTLTEDGLCNFVPFYQRDLLAKVNEGESFVMEMASKGTSILIGCFRSCTSGNCVKALEGLDSVKVSIGNVEIEVDGVPVTATREFDSCHLFEGKSNGLIWETKREAFRIRFRVKEEGGALLLYSVIAL